MIRINGITASDQELEIVREGAAILLNDVWHSAMIDFRCVSYRILWLKFKISRVKICVVVGCGPSEGDGEEMDRILDRVVNGYRLCILGGLN